MSQHAPRKQRDSTSDLILFAPESLLPLATTAPMQIDTPYGVVEAWRLAQTKLTWLRAPTPHALVVAAKQHHAAAIVELVPIVAVNRLLSVGDILVPHTLIDFTDGWCPTLFVEKGYGFVPQQYPYCPVLQSLLHEILSQYLRARIHTHAPIVFGRGTYAALGSAHSSIDLPELDKQHSHILTQWGVDAIGLGGAPTVFLARELELCYGMLGIVQHDSPLRRADTPHIPRSPWTETVATVVEALTHVREQLPIERTCVCASAMEPTRRRGIIGNDWQTWL